MFLDARLHADNTRVNFPMGSGRRAFWIVRKRIESGEYKGEQVDWAGWEANLSKAEIVELVEECLPREDAVPGPADALAHLREQATQFREFVSNLSTDRRYTVFVCET